MVKAGQVFKNYKELCAFLKEKECTGRSKELQLKRWQHSFSFHKEGYKIVVDHVYKDYIEDTHKGNNKHVKKFLPYIIYCLDQSGIKDEYVGNQRLVKSELKLISPDIYKLYNNRTRESSSILRKHGIRDYESFLTFTYNFEYLARETVERCFNVLSREPYGMEWDKGHVFIVGLNKKRTVYVRGYTAILEKIEESVCNDLNPEKKNGRRFLQTVKRDKELREHFYKECIRRLILDEQLLSEIKEIYEKQYGDEFVPEMIIEYHSVYYISGINRYVLRGWKLEKNESLTLKKALVNPGGPEMQTLKNKVYRDIFHRMNKKNNFGISKKDFENLLFLFSQEKLTKKNYKIKKEGMQDYGADCSEDWQADRG